MDEKKKSKRKEVYVYDDTKKKRDNRPQAASTHITVWKTKKTKRVCAALSHPHRGGVQILGWRQNLSLQSLHGSDWSVAAPARFTGGGGGGGGEEEEEEEEEDLDWLSNTKTLGVLCCLVSTSSPPHSCGAIF